MDDIENASCDCVAYGGSAKAPVIICNNTTLTAAYTNLFAGERGNEIVGVSFNVAYEVYIKGLEMRLCQVARGNDICSAWYKNDGSTVSIDDFNGADPVNGFYLQSRVVSAPYDKNDACTPVLSPGHKYSSVSVTYRQKH